MSSLPPLLEPTDRGLRCATGGFFIDPWAPVERAVITHAHSDHAHPGSEAYLSSPQSAPLLRRRFGDGIVLETLAYGMTQRLGDVTVSLHPAGHMLGSAQVRLERAGEVWVVSGDYKLAADPTCVPFEPVRCHTFVTESTFGIPVYRWDPAEDVVRSIECWWKENASQNVASVLFAYSTGKAQRLLASLDTGIGPIAAHGAVASACDAYRNAGVSLPAVHSIGELDPVDRARALVLAPPWAQGSPWLRRCGNSSFAFASGWMLIRGLRKRKAVDRGFPISDHADWDGLNSVVRSTGASRVWVTHGFAEPFARWLVEQGFDSSAIATQFTGEMGETVEEGEGDPEEVDGASSGADSDST